jgi:hypothetical protein
VPHIAADRLDIAREIRGKVPGVAVHLGVERVEHTYAMAPCQQRIRHVRADEARTSGDQDELTGAH